MKKKFENLLVTENTNLQKVLKKIDINGKNGVFVIGKNKKISGVVTDSDIRKSILDGKFNRKKSVKHIMQRNFLSINHSKMKSGKDILLNSNKILIPVFKNGRLYSYLHTSEFFKDKKNLNKREYL